MSDKVAPDALSKREREVAMAYASGDSYKEIARALGLSPTTIRSHLRTVYSKLGVTSKIELAQSIDNPTSLDDRDRSDMAADLALELDEAIRRERSLSKVLKIISQQSGDLEAVIDAVLDHALEICEAEFGVLFEFLNDGRAREMQSRNIAPAFADWFADTGAFDLDPKTAIGRMAATRQTVNIADVRGEDIYKSGTPLRIATADLGNARSFAAIPMMSGNRLIGAFTVYRTRVHPFNERALELAQVFADQAAIAIETVRQFQEVQRRLESAQKNREILDLIRQSRDDEQPVFDAIVQSAVDLCKAQFCMLWRYDGTDIHYCASDGFTEAFMAEYLVNYPMAPNPNGIVHKMIQARETVHLPNAQAEPYSDAAVARQHGYDYMLAIPVETEGQIWGAMVLAWPERITPDESQVELLETFAAQAVIALENAAQFRALQARLDRAAATREVLEAIRDSRDDEAPVLDVILRRAAQLCGADAAAMTLGREGEAHQRLAAALDMHPKTRALYRDDKVSMNPETSLVARAIVTGKTLHVPDYADTDDYRAGEEVFRSLVDDTGLRTSLNVPLLSEGRGIGALVLYRKTVKPYAPDQIALVETFAAQAVIAIENVRQFRELQTRLERQAATREILDLIARSRDDETPVFEAIIRNAQRLCDTQAAVLILGRAGGPPQRLLAHTGISDSLAEIYNSGGYPMDPEFSIGARAIVEKRVIHIEDMSETQGYKDGAAQYRAVVDSDGIRTNLFVPMVLNDEGVGFIAVFRRERRPFTTAQIALLETFAAQAAIAVENVRQFQALETLNASLEERVQDQVGEIERMGRLKRFLSPAVADALISSGEETRLTSHRALIATLFCDIRGFTAFCERAEPEETIEVLQAYHEQMGLLISAHGGGVDKRMGDGIMVIFNDPLPCDDPAGDAVRLAIAMRERMAELCKAWKRLGHRLGFGVGISLGYATIGMVGSEGRYDYTASGTSVNLAARLCDRAEDGDILLSPRAHTAIEDDFQAENSGEIDLKGLREPVEVFRLMV